MGPALARYAASSQARTQKTYSSGRPRPTTFQEQLLRANSAGARQASESNILAKKFLRVAISRVDGLHRNRKTGRRAPDQDADIDTQA